jgi:hypothetical protein
MDVLTAEAEIRQMHARYANAVWRRDFATIAEIWTEDAEFRIAGLVHQGRDQIMAFMQRAFKDVDWVLMEFGTPIVHLEDDNRALSRVQCREENILMKGVGIYWERLVRQDGRWRRRWAMFELHYIERDGQPGRRLEQPDYGPPPAFPPLDTIPINHSKIHKY